jgi:hypothetical protein
MKWYTPKGMIVVVFLVWLSPSAVFSGIAGEDESLVVEVQRGGMSRFLVPGKPRMQHVPESLSEKHDVKINANRCMQSNANQSMGLNQALSQHPEHAVIQVQNPGLIYLAAMDSLDGSPPCGQDNVCNLAVCPNDPDCPADMPEINRPGPTEPDHDEKGIGTSVWLTTGPDGFEGGHFCPPGGNTCDIMVTWSVQPDRYDKWKICWKEYGTAFTNACDENEKIRNFENNSYLIPNLKKDEKYRIRLEGRKDKNDKWKCLAKATLRNVNLNGTRVAGVVPCIVP